MENFFDVFFFGLNSKKSVSDYYKLNKKWAGLNIFYDLLSLVMSRFVYDFPDTMDARFFELVLLCNGVNGTARGTDGEISNFKVGYGNKFQKYGRYNNCNLIWKISTKCGNSIFFYYSMPCLFRYRIWKIINR